MSEPTNRRNFLGCMAWAGTGVLWTVSGGLAASVPLDASGLEPNAAGPPSGGNPSPSCRSATATSAS